jgi:penicillin-binding protein 1A
MLRWLAGFIAFLLVIAIIGSVGVLGVFHYFGRNLPDYQQLADYEMPVTTKVYASDGQFVKQYMIEDRAYFPLNLIPENVAKAFLAAEDKNFYHHPGIDPFGMARALINNIINKGSKRPQGASTITQQVARNFFLSDEVSIARKIREAILAFRIEKALTKDRILELYLNKIYFGFGAYGVAKAAWNYFSKPLEELTLAEMAYLAALPKAPSNYHPFRNHKAAIIRRDYVIQRMLEARFIDKDAADAAKTEPLVIKQPKRQSFPKAEYYTEEIRRFLIDRYGMDGLYGGGLTVRSPLDVTLQQYADHALRQGLASFDRRHGWRGPITHIKNVKNWQEEIKKIELPKGLGDWKMGVLIGHGNGGTRIGFVDGTEGIVPNSLRWSGRVGDVVPAEKMTKTTKGKPYPEETYAVRQIPIVNGGVIVMDPHTGRIYAVAGGFSFEASEFNRATQAMRQTGSAFKPFIYLAALDNGYTPNTILLDAPITIRLGHGLPPYTPRNYGRYFGHIPLRRALEKSLNSAAVRLTQQVGVETVAFYGEKLGIADHMPRRFSIALGAQETTVLRLTAAYAMLANGGKKITGTFVDSIQNKNGEIIYSHDKRECDECHFESWKSQDVPQLVDVREQLLSPLTAFQMVSILEGVVERGTAVRLKSLKRPLAGKTGTSTNFREAWFMGFSPDLVCGVYVGYDNHKSLGYGETGSHAALPVFKEFMSLALKDTPIVPFRIPSGIRLVPTNLSNGEPMSFNDQRAFYEAYKPGTEPNHENYTVPRIPERHYVELDEKEGLPWLNENAISASIALEQGQSQVNQTPQVPDNSVFQPFDADGDMSVSGIY